MGKTRFFCYQKNCLKEYDDPQLQWQHMTDIHNGEILCPYSDCETTLPHTDIGNHLITSHETPEAWEWKTCTSCGVEFRHEWFCRTIHSKMCIKTEELDIDENEEVSVKFLEVESDRKVEKPAQRCQKLSCTYEGCEKYCNSIRALRSHLDNHDDRWQMTSDGKKAMCTVPGCGAILSDKGCAKRHIKIVHDKPQETCKNCGQQVLFLHLKRHVARCTTNNDKRFQCTVDGCPRKFYTKDDRIKHEKVVHERVMRTCKNCGKTMVFANIYQHMKRCTKAEKKHKCDVEGCKSKFHDKSELKMHKLQVHEKVGTKLICPYCGLLITNFSNVTRHMRTCSYNGGLGHRCVADGCWMIFSSKTKLTDHMKTVHKKLKEPCKKCGKEMSYENFPLHYNCTSSS